MEQVIVDRYGPQRKRYFVLQLLLDKARERGMVTRGRILWAKVYPRLRRAYPTLRSITWPSKSYTNSVLAICDFRATAWDFSVVQFLANCETYRVENSLSHIDLVMVVNPKKPSRGDQPEVTQANYRNWMLNLAEGADLLPSVSSLSIFDDEHKFLSFFHRARYTHKVFPYVRNPIIYQPMAAEPGLRRVTDYFHRTGYVPRFESSRILLDWAEAYLLRNSYPKLPIVVFIRNSKAHAGRNSAWAEWLSFFTEARREYAVKFFIINDFWNPFVIPEGYDDVIQVCEEGTISHKYRAALMQRAALIIGTGVGPFFSTAPFLHTPFLMFGFGRSLAYFPLDFQKRFHGFTDDCQLPWLSKYQKMIMGEDADIIAAEFKEMYALLQAEGRLVPAYWTSPAPVVPE